MTARYILSIDQGTTSSRALIFDQDGSVVVSAQREFGQIFPRPGWVEHDPQEIWSSVVAVVAEAIARCRISSHEVAAIGIANQRETTVVWERSTGKPVHNAIVWQSRQSESICDELAGADDVVAERTGLVIDPYFSGTKIRWILDNVPGAREKADRGDLLFGTIDSWLLWNLTGGKAHLTDATNASRTLLFNIHRREWDQDLLDLLGIPASMLPRVCASSGTLCETEDCGVLHKGIPISGVAGDQQASMFGHACFQPGMVKSTYGTGCFVMMNTGPEAIRSSNGMLTTIAWEIDGRVEYALEGSVFVGGAVVQWLRDGLQVISSARETQALAASVESADGVYVVPAFVGLGAPYWNRKVRGAILGLSRGTRREHVVRASLESIAFQVRDVVVAMQEDAAMPASEIRADGGAIANDFLAQFQSDVLGVKVCRPAVLETTALGAAYLAGIGCGLWGSVAEVSSRWRCERTFQPCMDDEVRIAVSRRWRQAVDAASAFVAE